MGLRPGRRPRLAVRGWILAAMAASARALSPSTAGHPVGNPVADNPTSPPGPFATVYEEYRLDAAVDELVLPDRAVEYWAVVWRPVDPDPGVQLPLAVFLHGNHATCGTGEAPRVDSNSQYTMQGTCPDGFRVVPNHRGYDYIAEGLASHGYIAISINANRGINSGSGVEGDARLIKARGALILGHLALLAGWERDPESSPLEAPLPPIDWARVGIFGHSRGGEAARCAFQFIVDPARWGSGPLLARLGEDVEDTLRVRAILEVGAVDYNGREINEDEGTFDADESVAWVAVVPACDGDVSHLAGVRPGDRLQWSRSPPAAAGDGMSSTLFVYGTNHNFYSTEWQTSDSSGCLGHEPLWPSQQGEHSGDCPECREPARFATMALFRGVLGEQQEDADLLRLFDPRYAWPASENLTSTIEQGMVPTAVTAAAAAASSGTTQQGPMRGHDDDNAAAAVISTILPLEDFSGGDVQLEIEGDMAAAVINGGLWAGAGGEPRVVNHDETQRAVLVEWEGDAQLTVLLTEEGTGNRSNGQQQQQRNGGRELAPIDLGPSTGLTHLLLRLQRAENFTLNSLEVPTEFGVSLRLADGSHGPYVPIAAFLPVATPLLGPVGGPANSRNNFYGYHPILRTLPIPLEALGDAAQLQQVTGVRLELGATPATHRRHPPAPGGGGAAAAVGSPSGAILLANLSAAVLPPLDDDASTAERRALSVAKDKPRPPPLLQSHGGPHSGSALSGSRHSGSDSGNNDSTSAEHQGVQSALQSEALLRVHVGVTRRSAPTPVLRNTSDWALELTVRVSGSPHEEEEAGDEAAAAAPAAVEWFGSRDTGLSLCYATGETGGGRDHHLPHHHHHHYHHHHGGAGGGGGGAAVRRRREVVLSLLSPLVRYGADGGHSEVTFTVAGARVQRLLRSLGRDRAQLWVVEGECAGLRVDASARATGHGLRSEGVLPLGMVDVAAPGAE